MCTSRHPPKETVKVKQRRKRSKGKMSFDEDELMALQRNRAEAVTRNIALANADDTRLMVPELKPSPEGAGEEEEAFDSKETVSSAEREGKENVEDPVAIFESLEKPEVLDMKKEAETEKQMRKHMTLSSRKATKERGEVNSRQKSSKSEKLEESFKKMQLEDAQATTRNLGKKTVRNNVDKHTSLKEASSSSCLKSEKTQKLAKLTIHNVPAEKSREKELERREKHRKPASSCETDTPTRKKNSQKNCISSSCEADILPRRKSSQKKDVFRTEAQRLSLLRQKVLRSKLSKSGSQIEKPLALDVSQKSERKPMLDISQRAQKIMDVVLSRRARSTPRETARKSEQRSLRDVIHAAEASQRSARTQRTEQILGLHSSKLPVPKSFETAAVSDEIGARTSLSMPAINFYRHSRDPPTCHYKFVTVQIKPAGEDLELTLTENLVLIFIPFTSPVFFDLVIGDQIIECDGLVPRNLRELQEFFSSAEKEVTLGVARAWNVHPPTPKRMDNVWPLKKYCYLIVELPLIKNLRAGYEFQCAGNRLYLSKVEPQTMGAFAFLAVDRVLDVDSDKIPPRVNMVALKNRIRAVQERDGFCTFLVERPSSLHHVTNPSCVAMKSEAAIDGVVMGDDAIEIGTREAFKYVHVKNKQKSTSVYRVRCHESDGDLMTAEEDSEVAAARHQKKRRRKLRMGKNPKEKAIPSDVKKGTVLSKASESSLRKLVTKFISKTFLTGMH